MVYRILFFFLLGSLLSCAEVKKKDIVIISTQPAQKWQDALIAGNGVQGVMVMGDPLNETIVLNHERLWVPAQNVAFDVPDMKKVVPEVRNLAKKGNRLVGTERDCH